MNALKPNWLAMTKKQQQKTKRRYNSMKRQQTRLRPVERKDERQNNADVSPVCKLGVLSTRETKTKRTTAKSSFGTCDEARRAKSQELIWYEL